MKNLHKVKNLNWLKRHKKIRKRIVGTKFCPRISVYRSLKHIYSQLIDDEKSRTLISASDLELGKKEKSTKNKIAIAREVGKILAEKAIKKNIKKVVFDRGGFKYHGRIKSLAEGAREGGLKF